MAYIEEHQYSIWEEGWKQPKPPMNVLVACEESQAVCKAFRARGHNAFSCDVQECSGGHPEWHIKGDALELIQPTFRFYEHGEVTDRWIQFRTQDGEVHENRFWDLIIAHPPCTHLTVSGARHFGKKRSDGRQREAVEFFCHFLDLDCPRVVIENPVGIISGDYVKEWFPDLAQKYGLPREPQQIIQPYEYGEHARKTTCLWLKGVPRLESTKIVDMGKIDPEGQSFGASLVYARDENGKILPWNDPRTAKARSKTFPGIAAAMAEQWG